jgi:hypothetical protein
VGAGKVRLEDNLTVDDSKAAHRARAYRPDIRRIVWRHDPAGLDVDKDSNPYTDYDELIQGLAYLSAAAASPESRIAWATSYFLEAWGIDVSRSLVIDLVSDIDAALHVQRQ